MNTIAQIWNDIYAYIDEMMLAPEELEELEERERLRQINNANFTREQQQMVRRRNEQIRREEAQARVQRERIAEQQRLSRGYASKVVKSGSGKRSKTFEI